MDAEVAYLPKPFSPAQLSIKVREVLGQSKTAGRILGVDDDAARPGHAPAGLLEAGYEVMHGGRWPEGNAPGGEHPFDLVLTDLVMPDREGIETIRDLRRDYPAIRIVAMSGRRAAYLKQREKLGAHVTLRKPIDCQELVRIIRERSA